MIKTITFTLVATYVSSAAFATEITYDPNESWSPADVGAIKAAYAADFVDPAEVVAAYDMTESFSPADAARIKAAFDGDF